MVKIGGIPWFNAMEVGIKDRAAEFGWDAWMVGPTSAGALDRLNSLSQKNYRRSRAPMQLLV